MRSKKTSCRAGARVDDDQRQPGGGEADVESTRIRGGVADAAGEQRLVLVGEERGRQVSCQSIRTGAPLA
ncbi:MAG: hypothetical protein DK306_001124 [Chloroflexi bacterium]|nr:MAG: hypothetical protein DK306_001124 [Chloroflexota bacterium]